MKHNWTYKKLGEVCNTVSGGTPSKTHSEYYDNGTIPWLRSGELSQSFVYSTEIHITERGLTNSSAKIVPVDTVSIAMYGATVGEVAIIKVPMCTNQAICNILPNDNVISGFLRYFLVAQKHRFVSLAAGGAQPNISQNIIRNTLIPIPSLDEQQAIVRELDGINRLIDLQEEQLREYDRLAQSLFYTTFGDPVSNPKGWVVKKLGEIAREKLSYGSGASAVMFDGTTRYVRITDIKDNGELNDDIVSPNAIEDKYLLNEGDILFARSGATVGKTYMHKNFNGRCIYAGYLIRLIPNKDIVHPTYLFHLTKTEYYHEFIASGQRTVAQPNINAQQYGNFRLPLPPLSLQQTFAAQIEAIEQQKALVRRSLDETRTLLAARMQYYFE